MTGLIKTRNVTGADGKITQHALWDAGASFQIHRWEEATYTNRVVEEIPYEGHADRRAARAMAMGCLDSLHRQALHETHGATHTDKNGIAMHWSDDQGRYVANPQDGE